ncbi:hypothetical protein V6K52_15890 [Knoellia sp. S7-12]|uniref:hypothetical protein n=1 Tax=Knoellia sp. S7-12 TaxID=3126698 RepID=UPI003367C0F8
MTKGHLVKAVKARTTALALAGVLALSACSGTSSAETAAVVDGRVITEQQLREATDELNLAFPREGRPYAASEILGLLIRAPYVNEAATKAGRPQSESAARAEFKNLPEAPSDAAVDVIQADMSGQQLDEATGQALLAEFGALDISINPRYGTFDPQQASVVPTRANWLVPAPAASVPSAAPAQ